MTDEQILALKNIKSKLDAIVESRVDFTIRKHQKWAESQKGKAFIFQTDLMTEQIQKLDSIIQGKELKKQSTSDKLKQHLDYELETWVTRPVLDGAIELLVDSLIEKNLVNLATLFFDDRFDNDFHYEHYDNINDFIKEKIQSILLNH